MSLYDYYSTLHVYRSINIPPLILTGTQQYIQITTVGSSVLVPLLYGDV